TATAKCSGTPTDVPPNFMTIMGGGLCTPMGFEAKLGTTVVGTVSRLEFPMDAPVPCRVRYRARGRSRSRLAALPTGKASGPATVTVAGPEALPVGSAARRLRERPRARYRTRQGTGASMGNSSRETVPTTVVPSFASNPIGVHNPPPMIVMKFGGTSVGVPEHFAVAVRLVREAVPRDPVVVVSAFSGVTNLIVEF